MLTYNKGDIFTAGTILNDNRNSLAMQLENMFGFAIQVVFTGTPTGTFKLQASCDPVPAQRERVGANGVITFTPTNWTDVEDSDFTVTAAGSVFWNYSETVNWTYVRAVYTDGSGHASTAVITSSRLVGKGA